MNRVLFKAAAIVNIAAAALIYVACSGDDGKDGAPGLPGQSCSVAANPVSGYDITCGGTVVTLHDGAPGPQGIPGTAVGACTGIQVATGIQISCGSEVVGILTNGAPGPQGPAGPAGPGGGGPGGECDATNFPLNNGVDQGIKITCANDGSESVILVCPKENGFYETAAGAGFCNNEGLISRGGAALKCGGKQFDPSTHFCQRVFASGTNAGKFATLATSSASSATVSNTYPPTTHAAITGATSLYNLTEGLSTVKSTILPLCGLAPSKVTVTDVSSRHNSNTVYNDLQLCGRNLVILNQTYLDPNDSESDIIAGGKQDLDPAAPYNSTAWKVIDSTLCKVSLTSSNGFTFTVGGSPSLVLDRGCSFMEAIKVPYSQCPTAKPVFGLDDVICSARTDCKYHSVIDNTCLVKGEQDVVGLDALPTWATGGTVNAAASGIMATSITDNRWTKPCKTLSRTSYYAVNDPYLTTKAFATSPAVGDIPQPTCEDLTQVGNPPQNTQDAVAFEDAFSCLGGKILSLDAQGNRNDGTSYDKPLYCVSDPLTSCSSVMPTLCLSQSACVHADVGGQWTWTSGSTTLESNIVGTINTSDNATECTSLATEVQTAVRGVANAYNTATVTAGSASGTSCPLTLSSISLTGTGASQAVIVADFTTRATAIQTAINETYTNGSVGGATVVPGAFTGTTGNCSP
jgi:hypothetical protein